MKKCRIHIVGKVQGVAFRYYTKKKADSLGLRGTTENQADGSVVSIVEGEAFLVDEFAAWCKIGSPASSVDQVIVVDLDSGNEAEYRDFSILR